MVMGFPANPPEHAGRLRAAQPALHATLRPLWLSQKTNPAMPILFPHRLFLALLSAPGLALAATADFNGAWKLDRIGSELSGRANLQPAAIKQTVAITIDGDRFTTVTRTPGAPPEKETMAETYFLDGKARDFAPPARAGSRSARGKRVAAWSDDKSLIVIIEEITREMADGAFTAHLRHTWSLSPDGQILTVATAIKSSADEIVTVRVFVRQADPAA